MSDITGEGLEEGKTADGFSSKRISLGNHQAKTLQCR